MVRRGEKRDSVRYALLLLRLKQGAKVKFLPVPPAHNHFPYFHDVEILLPRLRAREDRRKGFCSPFRAVSIFSFWCQWDDRVSLRSEDDGQVERVLGFARTHTCPKGEMHITMGMMRCPAHLQGGGHMCKGVGVCFSPLPDGENGGPRQKRMRRKIHFPKRSIALPFGGKAIFLPLLLLSFSLTVPFANLKFKSLFFPRAMVVVVGGGSRKKRKRILSDSPLASGKRKEEKEDGPPCEGGIFFVPGNRPSTAAVKFGKPKYLLHAISPRF